MNLKIILFLILAVIGIFILYLVLFTSEDGLLNDGLGFGKEKKGDESSPENSVGPGSGASGGGGGGGESGGSSGGSSGCLMQQISYSASDFNTDSVCNQYQGSVCIDKTSTCNVTITNLDDIGGVFDIDFEFFEEGNGSVLFSASFGFFLNPEEQHIFTAIFNAQVEDSDKNLTCSYNTVNVPEKEVC